MVSPMKKSVLGRWNKQSGKYSPHQGEREKKRRRGGTELPVPEMIIPPEPPAPKLSWWQRAGRYILGRS